MAVSSVTRWTEQVSHHRQAGHLPPSQGPLLQILKVFWVSNISINSAKVHSPILGRGLVLIGKPSDQRRWPQDGWPAPASRGKRIERLARSGWLGPSPMINAVCASLRKDAIWIAACSDFTRLRMNRQLIAAGPKRSP